MTRIMIEKGIVVFHKDGTITNFPEGNDEEYRKWAAEGNVKDAAVLLSVKDGVAEHIEAGSDYTVLKAYIRNLADLEFDSVVETIDDKLKPLDDKDEIANQIYESWGSLVERFRDDD